MPTVHGKMSLIVHGGAGPIPEAERPAHEAGLARALDEGWRVLEGGGGALDAIEAALRILEDDPAFDAGVGSILRLDGKASMDASIMDGSSRDAGAVACVRRVRYPVTLARRVLEKTPYVFLAGPGAEAFAEEEGLELREPAFFAVAREEARLHGILQAPGRRSFAAWETGGAALPGAAGPARRVFAAGGTVGAVARDARGRLAAATSTGGAPGTAPGRIGDTPVIGAGTFADDRSGGVSATGTGENILRVTLARELVRELAAGQSPAAAARWAVDFLRSETGGSGGVICLDRLGNPGAAFNTPWMGSRWRERPLD
jgi:beta-aspartyl-peptidase (threonine type)